MNAERNILVTGYSGQVGFELVRSLQGFGRIEAPLRAELDLANPSSIRTYLRTHRPSLIINPAAYTAVDQAEQDRAGAFAINGEAVAILAAEARQLGAAVIHYSTDYVFDGTAAHAYREEDETSPVNVYGASKLAGEQALRDAGVPHLIFRTSWVYSNRGANFLSTMLRLGREKAELRIVADQVGAPTWSRTIAELTAHSLAQGITSTDLSDWIHERSGVYNLTASGEASWADFAEAIFEIAGLERRPRVERISTAEFPRPAPRPLNSRMCGDKLNATFGLRAPNWRNALERCLEEQQAS
ncbi:dTDP-4-dehydrorhamnose reductase [Burkholderia multivorans]|uniref:dTDP-4-dehydrorhamnose reductase n=1 Tax=Burkholderia multivorans TaxID=87883 RepID=UPI001C2611E6|nr:dTDP-4-dehydrorhamnose reductase [Burkholderia multivorans]MBU9344580.1 dTDP-4-dehydrorhamnose reductase [Burkholderia multivorans]MCO1367577.1 dTDP-4-dehydrorhamnose reductase [Burkholderia multivorans]MCO1377185.1 dTDP-4-dehydrorhamnose reductase [Burkholderia multivorans]UQP19122.1 dTDP-4-dehydrorhamnose reductase [Burkholderia multivorans]UQP87093.1 dTDP-4-dehydrorhamnose reductase [Burkholderia multivorans]